MSLLHTIDLAVDLCREPIKRGQAARLRPQRWQRTRSYKPARHDESTGLRLVVRSRYGPTDLTERHA